jgi:hypothetical protein
MVVDTANKILEDTVHQASTTKATSSNNFNPKPQKIWVELLPQKPERWQQPPSPKKMKTKAGVMLEHFLIEI